MRSPVGEVAALGIGDAWIHREGRRLAAPGELDLVLRGEIVAGGIVQIEDGHGLGEVRRVRESAQLVGSGDARERYRLVHQPFHRSTREVRGGCRRRRLAGEDAQGQVLLAGVLDRIHPPQPDLGGEGSVLHEERIGGGGAPLPRPLQDVGQEIEHALDLGPADGHLVDPDGGNPTPTGTDWPSLPQVPIPSSILRSLPTRLTRVSASGPLPMRVAPLTGRVTLPSSIR